MKEFLKNQYSRLFLFVPFLMAFGAALYFSMPVEPHIANPILAFIACAIILIFGKINILLRGAVLFLFGFLYAAFYTQTIVTTPILKYDLRNTEIMATVHDIDISSDKTRVVLSVPTTDLRINMARDANIKLTVSDDKIPQIGDVIRANASLFPPAQMEAPESFDYARWAYFNDLTATGYIIDYEILNHKSLVGVNSIRNIIHNKSDSFLTDGLVLGYKNAVPKTDKDIWTTAGVGHIWSISGFHMTLIGGWLFAIFYLICRSIGFITRRIPARIVATIIAWILLFLYVCVSGFGIATWRAFLMTSLLFLALLVGRNAVSIRNICIAFLILFFVNPHFITQCGFQLSFAAIFGLIWFFDDKKFDTADAPWYAKIKVWFYVAAMTSVVATVFTLPFIATHFSYVPLYSLIGNLVLLPIFSVAIMPLVIVGTIFAMFDGHLFLRWATYIYDFTFHIAQQIAEMPMSNIYMPHIPDNAFMFFIVGLLCLIFVRPVRDSVYWIYRRMNYVLCVLCAIVGILIVATQSRPLFYATADHELIGMVYDSKLEFNKARASNHYFAFNTFRKLNGEPPANTNIRHKCNDGVCIYKSTNWTVAYVQKFKAIAKHFEKLCRDDDIDFIVSYFDISAPRCNHKILHGGFVIYESGKVKYTPINRWWNNPHE